MNTRKFFHMAIMKQTAQDVCYTNSQENENFSGRERRKTWLVLLLLLAEPASSNRRKISLLIHEKNLEKSLEKGQTLYK